MTFMHWLENRTEICTYGVKYWFNVSTSDIVGTTDAIVFDLRLLPIDKTTNHNFVKLSETNKKTIFVNKMNLFANLKWYSPTRTPRNLNARTSSNRLMRMNELRRWHHMNECHDYYYAHEAGDEKRVLASHWK